jgi:hypothetical protein
VISIEFVLHDKHQPIVITAVVLYVNDHLIIANEGLIAQIKDQMKKRIWMHDLGSVCFYLGMNIERNQEHHTIDIHQHCYIRTILAKFGIDDSKPVATLIAMKLNRRMPDEEASDPTKYLSIIETLKLDIIASRPDIIYVLRVLSP